MWGDVGVVVVEGAGTEGVQCADEGVVFGEGSVEST